MIDPDDAPDKQGQANGAALKKRGNDILQRIAASERREDKWRIEALAAEKAYSGDAEMEGDGKVYDFNILHSNVETIVPAIYNSTPVPDIRPRAVLTTGSEPQEPQPPQQDPQQPPDPQAILAFKKAVQQFQQSSQIYAQKKQSDDDAKAYGQMLERAIAVQIDDNRLDSEVESEAQDSFTAGRGILRLVFEAKIETPQEDVIEASEVQEPSGVKAAETVSGETISFESVSWRDYREGPASRWKDVPWVAFRKTLGEEAFEEFADPKLLELQPETETSGDKKDEKQDIEVWEFWDKAKRTVEFVRVADGAIVKRVDDPLELPDFFPCPQPVQPITLNGKRTPVCPFTVYKKLASELDLITKRINKIVSGMKVRGMVAGNAASIVKLSEAGDNEIVIEDNLEQLAQTGGIDKAIAWWPIEPAAKVLAQLYQQRDQVKAAIYEITGISDIVRGASNAGETATAQQIKTQWGSLRIQKMQRLIERQVRDVFVMMAHIISSKFSAQTLVEMTGIEVTAGVQALMDNPRLASYRINVESDSTIKADLSRQKQDMTEFMSGTANFFATVAPIVQAEPQAMEPLAEIYAASARMFKLGKQAEDALDRFVFIAKGSAQNPKPNPLVEQAKADAAMKEKELQLKADDLKAKHMANSYNQNFNMAKLELEKIKLDHMNQNADRSHQLAGQSHNLAMTQANASQNPDGSMRLEETAETKATQQLSEGLMQGLQMLAQSMQKTAQQNMMALEQIAVVISAPRKTELIKGPDGRPQSAISTPMVQ